MGALLAKPSPGAPAVRLVHPRPVNSSGPAGRFTSSSDLFPSSADSPISMFDTAQQQPQLSSPVVTRRIDLSRFHPKRSFDEGGQQADSSGLRQHQPDSPDARVLKDQLELLHIMRACQAGHETDGRDGSLVEKRLSTVTA